MSTITFDVNGLSVATQDELRAELAARLREAFGPNLKTSSPGVLAQIIDIVTELRALDHQAFLAIYRSFDPQAALGRPLDARLGLTGSIRKPATNSVVDGILTFSGAGTMSNGDLIQNDDNETQWQLTDGPHTSAGPWPEEIAAQMTAVETGPILANAGTTWSPITSVTNLDGFTNPTDDAEPGRDEEADGEARRRRLVELYAQGQGPLAAIHGAVSQVDGVVYARAYHNPTTQPQDSDAIPFKAFNVVVETNPTTPTAAQQQAIWDAIWTAMGAGGYAYGTDYVGSVTDAEGFTHAIAFDTVSEVDIDLEIDLVTTGTEDPITPNIEDLVAAKVLERATDELELHGRDVRRIDIEGIVADMLDDGEITGPYAVTVRMALKPSSPAGVNRLVVGIREKADFNSADITVIQV